MRTREALNPCCAAKARRLLSSASVRRHRPILAIVLLSVLVLSCSNDDRSLASRSRRVFGPLPAAKNADSAALVRLGRALYFSNELSVNRSQSCNSCHAVDGSRSGAEPRATSVGALGTVGRRNAPSVLNSTYHVAQFWDGRAATLEEQAKGPIINPVEMAMPHYDAVEERLRTSTSLDHTLFASAFPGDKDPYTIDHVARAIAAFERTLVTRDRFDDFQNGNVHALTRQEKNGLRVFMSTGCASCHGGPLLGGNKFMKLGVVNAYDNTADKGRAEVTHASGDNFVFKVPSLRNVGATAPYFHDGRVVDLPHAVERMAWHQLGKKIEPADRDAIVAFLRALSNEKQASK